MSKEWKWTGRVHLFGSELAHDNEMIDFRLVLERQTDPAIILTSLFPNIDPGFAERVRQGDLIVAGKAFGTGKAHTTAYIAMAALGMGVLCETSFEKVMLGAANLGLPIAPGCIGLSSSLLQGEEVEVDFEQGLVRSEDHTEYRFPALRPDLQRLIEAGGRAGLLSQWLRDHPEMATPLADVEP